jgi:uncharacterized Zn finger protein
MKSWPAAKRRWRECGPSGKIKFLTEAEAREAGQANADRLKLSVVVIRCGACGKFHIELMLLQNTAR